MKNMQKFFSILAFIFLPLPAATASATTIYVSNTEVDGILGASPWTSERAVHQTMRGEFTVNLAVPRVNVFLNGDPSLDSYYTIQQTTGGTASYDSTTHLFTLSNSTVKIGQTIRCGQGCYTSNLYQGSMNLAFYIFGENLADLTFVPDANFITISQVATPGSSPYIQWTNLYTPSQLNLSYSGVVPLPAAGGLFGSALCGLVCSRRKSRTTTA